jgi:hypothetical protein
VQVAHVEASLPCLVFLSYCDFPRLLSCTGSASLSRADSISDSATFGTVTALPLEAGSSSSELAAFGRCHANPRERLRHDAHLSHETLVAVALTSPAYRSCPKKCHQ